jgi:aminomethyltransferase
MTHVESVARTALYEKHVALGARMAAFAGFEMPMWYEGIKAEHAAVRDKAGLFDLSHMGEIFIEGRQAFDLIQWLTCNDLRRIGDGQCQYTLFPTPQGGVVDDLIVYQITPESYMLVVNASNIAKDYAWIVEHNKFDCTVNNRSDEFSLIAVQGPQTNKILEAIGLKHIASQAAFTFKQSKVDGKRITVAGTGYTGERGFELIVPNEDAFWLWDRLFEAGEPLGAVPVGLGARDTLRLEMAYSLYGHELADDISVLEANLAWTVRFGPDFLGKEFLLKQKEEGLKRIIAGLVVEERAGAPRNGAPVYNATGGQIGHVTSGSHSPSLDKSIALALIEIEQSGIGNSLQTDIRGKKVPVRVCETPFYTRKK